MKSVLFCLPLAALAAGPARADKTPQMAPVVQKARPISLQRIGADLKPIGPVYPYQEDGGLAQAEVLAFDCFSPDVNGYPTDGLYGADCGMGSSRWYLGTTYHNPHHAFDIHLSPGTEGKLATRIEFAWFDSRPYRQPFYALLWPIEDYDASCTGPAFSSTYDGIIIEVNEWQWGRWFIDVRNITIPFQLPVDGVGGIVAIYAQDITGSSITFVSPSVQPMLWGTFDPNCDPPGNNTNFQVATQWDDDNPLDGSFNPAPPPAGECYSYYYGVCPDPLGAMYCFYVNSGPEHLRCDANCDGVFDGFDVDPFFLLLQSDWLWQMRYHCDPVLAGDANCDKYVDGLDIDPFFAGLEIGACACP
jgi:hypothetical protein